MSDDFRPTTASSMSHFFKDTTLSQGANTIETPPQSPKQKYTFPAASTSDDTPLSPTRSGAGLARSVNRHPRTSSLATIDTERDGSVSPTHIRSPTSSIDLTNGDSSVPQRPSRRKLASSRRLPTRDSIDSASVASADVDA